MGEEGEVNDRVLDQALMEGEVELYLELLSWCNRPVCIRVCDWETVELMNIISVVCAVIS